MNRICAFSALLLLSACGSSVVPDSNPTAGGVGFGGYDAYTQQERATRDAELERRRTAALPEEQAIAEETLGVLSATQPLGTPVDISVPATVETTSLDPVEPPATPDNPNISDEQNFDAVSSRETIESDKQRLDQNRETYTIAAPEAVPDRPRNSAPNIVSFALATNNALGEAVHSRSGSKNQARFDRACARYGSSDQAQAAFLAFGGPKKDPKGLDPDGDGFACYWDPTPFRAARGG